MNKFIKCIIPFLTALIISAEALVIAALCIHLENYTAQAVMLAAVFLFVFVLLFLIVKKSKNFTWLKGLTAVVILPLLFASVYFVSDRAVNDNVYNFEDVDNGKNAVFSDRNVMLIVPHEDDEVFLLGGTIEEYIRYGSEVNVVFVTNGDAFVTEEMKEKRLNEAIAALSFMGVDENHVIFLGYGDSLKSDKGHIYNSDPEKIFTSAIGCSSAYGLPEHPAFNEGVTYTRNNLKNDIKDVVLSYRPDVIYCVDYDEHWDHRAVSLLFEESMGEILSTENDYKPLVFKGFAYSTSMYAEPDYNQRNIISTVNPYKESYMKETNVYNWDERVRIPVAASSLSRVFRGTDVYKALTRHRSQTVYKFAQGAANSDKVFWQRETTSLLYNADFRCGDKKLTLLNDFKIADSANILDAENSMSGSEDVVSADGIITVTLPQKTLMDRIVIYDNPSVQDNVSGVIITFDDGTEVRSDKIEKNGSGTDIVFARREVKSFTVEAAGTEGNEAGFSEIEAFDGKKDYGFDFIKISDSQKNYIYDYLTDKDSEEFIVEKVGNCSGKIKAFVDSSKCSAEIKDDKVTVNCPKGETCLLTVTDESGHSDTVRISHLKSFAELDIALSAENFFWKTFRRWNQKEYYDEMKKEILN